MKLSRNDKYFLKLVFLALQFIVFGMIMFHYVERLSWLDAYYLSAITLTTVGYGDITPVTDVGKILATLYAFFGIGIFFALIDASAERRLERRVKREEKRKKRRK